MKSARNRGQAFEKRRGFLREQCASARMRYVYACAPVAAITDDQRDAPLAEGGGGEIHRTIKTIGRGKGNAVPSPILFPARDDERSSVPTRLADSIEREAARRANTTEGEATGAARPLR